MVFITLETTRTHGGNQQRGQEVGDYAAFYIAPDLRSRKGSRSH